MFKGIVKFIVFGLVPIAATAQQNTKCVQNAAGEQICEHSQVSTVDHRSGTVEQVFGGGVLFVNINGVRSQFDVEDVSLQRNQIGQFYVGQAVDIIEIAHRTGEIYQIFADGYVLVSIRGGGNIGLFTSDITPVISCLTSANICEGDTVSRFDHRLGVVARVFTNGDLSVTMSNSGVTMSMTVDDVMPYSMCTAGTPNCGRR